MQSNQMNVITWKNVLISALLYGGSAAVLLNWPTAMAAQLLGGVIGILGILSLLTVPAMLTYMIVKYTEIGMNPVPLIFPWHLQITSCSFKIVFGYALATSLSIGFAVVFCVSVILFYLAINAYNSAVKE